MGESSSNKRLPLPEAASVLTEDLVIEILSRLPYSSLCCFKCVSKSWLVLCSDPEIRKKSSQTLSGFFYTSISRTGTRHFTNLSGRGRPMVDPSLPFLPSHPEVEFLDCSNATRGVSSSYHNDQVTGVEIYSSETGVWTYRESEWGDDIVVGNATKSVFFDGVMHFTTAGSSLATVDREGKTWRKIPTPHQTLHAYIGVSQGRLYSVHRDWAGHEIAVLGSRGL
ncbi:hypothetical protein ACQ4PT_005025 [Festuca glaucescens]